MSRLIKSSVFILLFLGLSHAFAQSSKKQELEQKKVRLMDEIALANRILAETQKDRKNSIGNIETVRQKIKLRENLIRTLDKEIELLEQEQNDMDSEVQSLSTQVEEQKKAYAEMIQQAYNSKSNSSRLMFILSSEDFNQSMKRIEYLKQYSQYRKEQAQEIEASQKELNQKIEELRVQKVRKEAVRTQLDSEKNRLGDERLSQQQAIAEFQKMEKDLEKDLKAKQAEASKVEKEIQKIIAAEIKRAKELAARKQLEDEAIDLGLIRGRDFTSNTASDALKELIKNKRAALAAANIPAEEIPEKREVYALTPEATQLSANFSANQRRLPWPVERGLVVAKFGSQRHPVVKSVIIENRGIDIASERGSSVRAIFDGEISSVIPMPEGYRAIILNHGHYFSVYQNVSDVKIAIGQKVKKGDILGNVALNPITNQSKLHFEIWKDEQVMDPLIWLAAK